MQWRETEFARKNIMMSTHIPVGGPALKHHFKGAAENVPKVTG